MRCTENVTITGEALQPRNGDPRSLPIVSFGIGLVRDNEVRQCPQSNRPSGYCRSNSPSRFSKIKHLSRCSLVVFSDDMSFGLQLWRLACPADLLLVLSIKIIGQISSLRRFDVVNIVSQIGDVYCFPLSGVCRYE